LIRINSFNLTFYLVAGSLTFPITSYYRSGIVREVDLSLSLEEIHKGIKFMDRPIEIKSISRLKFRGKNNNELRDSFSVKIEFLSNFLPEFISIWSVRNLELNPINRICKCFNCLKWGHFSAFCRGTPICSGCGKSHTDLCSNVNFTCPDCNENHPPLDNNCSIFQNYKIVNYIMARCNINQYNAKKLAKIRNIICKQVETNFKSSDYLA